MNWFDNLFVVLCYIFAGGSRAAAWANTFQTIVFMVMGILAFYLISDKLGGLSEAIEQANDAHLVRTPSVASDGGHVGVPPMMFLSYMKSPLDQDDVRLCKKSYHLILVNLPRAPARAGLS